MRHKELLEYAAPAVLNHIIEVGYHTNRNSAKLEYSASTTALEITRNYSFTNIQKIEF